MTRTSQLAVLAPRQAPDDLTPDDSLAAELTVQVGSGAAAVEGSV